MIFTFIINKIGGYNGVRNKFKTSNSSFMKKLFLFLNKGFQLETNSYLPFDNSIDGYINFFHGTSGIFISTNASIGKNCTIFQQVTIGSNMLIDSIGFGHPTIGDNCLIGAGAKIIGKVKVGNNCRIGANAVVVKDVPDNSVIVLSNTVIYQKENLCNKIYQYTNKGWGYLKDGLFIKECDRKIINDLEERC